MTTKTLFSTKFTTKPPIFGAGRSKLDHRFITEKYLEERNPLYISQPDDLMRGLVLWLNDQGKSAATWKDMTPGGTNDGTVYGAGTPPPATPGALGYTFDGIDDYVNFGNLHLNFSQITVSFWYRSSVAHDTKVFMGKNTGFHLIYAGWDVPTTITWAPRINGVTKYAQVTGVNFTDNKWHNVVFSYNGSNIYTYYDNILKDTDAVTGNIDDSDNNFIIGLQALTYNLFTGSIDDVRIYNRALSASEISSLFNLERGKYGV